MDDRYIVVSEVRRATYAGMMVNVVITVLKFVAALSIALKEWLFRWTRAVARRIKSSALEANAWHHRSDALSSISVVEAHAIGNRAEDAILAAGLDVTDAVIHVEPTCENDFQRNGTGDTFPFPPIDFAVPSDDEFGRYALLTGVGPDDLAASPYDQVFSAFVNLERRLAEVGMDFSNVVRTWLYGADILTWYPELNRARKDFFLSRGVFDRFVPASTGVGWDSGTGAKIVMGAFAVKAKTEGAVTVEALPSPLQCPALEYGASFSRAAEVRTDAWRRVVVSGTASIEPNSHVVAHVGDVDAQIECTLRAVAAIYESRGLSLADITGALIYIKEERFRPAWERWLARHPEFPRAHSRAIVADVCRPEWLFEIESEAITRSVISAENYGII